jgi:hypothetical protein
VQTSEADRRRLVTILAEVIAGSRKHDAVLTQIGGGVDGLKGSWLEDMLEGQRKFRTDPDWLRIEGQARREVSFADYFAGCAPDMAVAHAEPHGCADACRNRGVDGLLNVPAVRLCVGVVLSQIYAQVFGTRGQPDVRRPNRGDGYDVWHAILASTAEPSCVDRAGSNGACCGPCSGAATARLSFRGSDPAPVGALERTASRA